MNTILSSPITPALQSGEPHSIQPGYYQAMERLITVVQELSLARDLPTIMTIVKHAARELTKSDGASFVLRDQDQCFYADEDSIAPLWKGQRFPIEICLGGWTMIHRQPAIISDIYGDERVPYAAYQPTFVKSLAMVPIRTLDPIGAIGIYWAILHQPTAEEVKLLQALADTTAVAMENVQVYSELEQRVRHRTSQLQTLNQQLAEEIGERRKAEAEVRQLSLTDELTGLLNRRGFFVLAEQQLKLARRLHTSCWIIFIDLDGLKIVNDTWGHDQGDALIRAMAQVLKQTFRESDIVARLGGDEFVIFAPNCIGYCENIESRLKYEIDQFNENSFFSFQLSMSVGSINFNPSYHTRLEELVTQADELMYTQKRLKRNQKSVC
ncbi:Diguanylate cyclase DosC [Planktothrix tepida]|uniref:Diguanylate cyclase with GAF sensor n=2 Tax=Planktothrix TaxID=54304 RepID=A0A1J1LPZ6_9CYAN|nr:MULTISPECIES: sensor domain-containing diguanylate cyclase [Planktothrix]CAD5936948.1 Diguanylate cyclase DosC [Planktothrix pseudagardhii]CAD5973416.1 Diguanylate cyclase DosC [Planktothrix tepida]CUR33988.1 Diguanylate cyclase with GAF sensor [Planktothrix tepida PCC 9214]